MKTKSLFLTLALLFVASVSYATTTTETITPAKLIAGGVSLTDGAATSFSNVSVDIPTIKYAGNIGYDETYGAFYLTSSLNISVTNSNYKVKSVTVTWYHPAGMTGKKNNLYVFTSEDAFIGTETNGALAAAGYSGYALSYNSKEPTKSTGEIDDVKFFCLTSQKINNTYFSQITIEWEELSEFDVIIGSHTNGTIEINGSTTPGAIEVGDDVTMLLTPDVGYELVSYTIGGSTTPLTPAERTSEPYEVHFDMPSSDVTVSAVFSSALARLETSTYISDEEYTTINSSAGAPLTLNVSETLEYILLVEDENGDYFAGDVSNLSYSWATGGIATVSTFTYDGSEEEGVLEIEGLAMGTDVLTINFTQTDDYAASSVNIYVKVVVPTHTAALVAEVDGRYYALTKTLTAGKLGAEEVIVANGKVFYDSDIISASDITWVISATTNALGDPAYTIQKVADGDFLSRSGTNFIYQAAVQIWDNTDDKPTLGSRYIGFNADKFEVSSTASVGAYEILTINAMPDAFERTQPDGKLSTLCFPFTVHLESPFFDGIGTVYSVTGAYRSGETVTGIALDEVTSPILEAGVPYIFETTSANLYVQYGEKTTAATRGYATGLVGNLEAGKLYVPDNGYCYGISNNQIRRVTSGATAYVGQYKAYIDTESLPDAGASSAPGRLVMYAVPEEMENPNDNGNNNGNGDEGQNVGTSLEDFLNNASPINWNEPVYNTLGQQVGRGTTGVLIQNGQKFLVK